MALPADFSKIFGSTATGGLTPISDVNYAKGWEFVGSNPPTKNDFSYLQNFSDLKSQWLYSNKLQRANPFGDIKADGSAAVSAALANLGLGEAAKRDVGADSASKLLDLGSFSSMMSGNGYIYIPCIATSGNPVKLMLQWGTVATQKGVDARYALPFAFPYAALFATGNRGTSGYNAAMNVRIASRTHISIQNWAPSGEGTEDCCFIALGY